MHLYLHLGPYNHIQHFFTQTKLHVAHTQPIQNKLHTLPTLRESAKHFFLLFLNKSKLCLPLFKHSQIVRETLNQISKSMQTNERNQIGFIQIALQIQPF